MKRSWTELRISVRAVLSLAVIVCGLYPGLVWLAGQGLFPRWANGSLIEREGAAVGSELIGQPFSGPEYFHPRPSAAGSGYDGAASGGSNLGPLSKNLVETVRRRMADFRAENGLSPETLVPADAVTASGSGLDPHISPRNAALQAGRVARERGMSLDAVLERIRRHTAGRGLGVLGEPRVNVLTLNLDLDGAFHAR